MPILILACKLGYATLVKLLLSNGADVNVHGVVHGNRTSVPDDERSPLHAACARSHGPVVQILLDHGADTEKIARPSSTPLQVAVYRNHLSIVRLLLSAGAHVDHDS